MKLENKKILMVVTPKDFRDEEYLEPRKILEDAGAQIKVASIQGGTAVGVNGTRVNIDVLTGEADPKDYEAVLFVGGPGMAEISNDDTLKSLAWNFYNEQKLTTAICAAPAVLAKAGILKGKKATSWSGVEKDVRQGGAIFTGAPVTVDGRIVTADGPASARAFGEKVAEVLNKL